MSPMRWRALAIAALIPLLASCATPLPIYNALDPAATARVNTEALGEGWICANGKGYRLRAGSDHYAPIPAGQRVTLGRSYFAQGYNVTYRCNSAISFVPRPGGSYYANFEIAAERCRVEVYQEGAKNRVGLALEPTLGAPVYCGDS